MPKHYREDEQPIDVQDIRNLLLKCNNRRLKAYISQEATMYLQDLIKWKYREKPSQPDDLVFSVYFIKNAKPKRACVF